MNDKKYDLFGVDTERLTFRRVLSSDADEWIQLFDSPKVAAFLGMNPSLTPKEWNEKWFEKVNWRYDNQLGAMNAAILKSTGELVAQCGLLIQEIEGEEFLEIGYSVLPKYRGQGFAFECAKACKEHALQHHLADELISMINVGNFASEKVALKNGMRHKRLINNYKGGDDVNIFTIHL